LLKKDPASGKKLLGRRSLSAKEKEVFPDPVGKGKKRRHGLKKGGFRLTLEKSSEQEGCVVKLRIAFEAGGTVGGSYGRSWRGDGIAWKETAMAGKGGENLSVDWIRKGKEFACEKFLTGEGTRHK